MTINEARELVEKRRLELESELSRTDMWLDKRSLLAGLSSVAQMLCYLDLLERGRTPCFRIIDEVEPSLLMEKEIFA